MNEEEIKALVGEANYKQGMTAAEISAAVTANAAATAAAEAEKTLLASGKYLNKDMAEANTKKIQKELDDAKAKLQSTMTDEEKQAAIDAEAQKRIDELEAELKVSKLAGNKSKAETLMSEAKGLAGITEKETKDFEAFIDHITSDDNERTEKTAKSINDLVKKAYEKGVADATRGKLRRHG